MRAHAEDLPGTGAFTADEHSLTAARELRAAVRALFARAVRPGDPRPADATRLLPGPQAVARLNAAAALVLLVPELHWPDDADPVVHQVQGPPNAPADQLLLATLARAALTFLTGPQRGTLRACHGPRCVRYFLKGHPRQEWCKPSCGNRARVARHHQRHRGTT